ncbi:hypothetical protein SynMITS9220_02439 [Synechococcus sp. MIT S9220]|nr:hypothetical protein SynMITS9220_02439 [Synechococcus sp. MIT S9220]
MFICSKVGFFEEKSFSLIYPLMVFAAYSVILPRRSWRWMTF